MPAHALKPALLATIAAMHLKRVTPRAPLLKVITLRVLLVTVNHIAAILHKSALIVSTGLVHQTLALRFAWLVWSSTRCTLSFRSTAR